MRVTYALLRLGSGQVPDNVKMTFIVKYSEENDGGAEEAVAISTAVLSVIASLYALTQTYSWSKRSARIDIDMVTLIKLIIHLCSALAYAFFTIQYGVCMWYLVTFKSEERVVLLMPNDTLERLFSLYLLCMALFKLVEMANLLACQTLVDIFFIDWERPKGVHTSKAAGDGGKDVEKPIPVSIWRTYFVANEWNEMQSLRRYDEVVQVIVVVCVLSVFGVENLARLETASRFSVSADVYTPQFSKMGRFGVACSVYLLVAAAQWLYVSLFHERFIEDKRQQFVDLCSVANVSVFIMEAARFGYYIHGRSVHGHADTDLLHMFLMLRREQENAVGLRGLLPSSEHQTFEVLVPLKLRHQVDNILGPLKLSDQSGAANRRQTHSPERAARELKVAETYASMNRFLSAFLEHSLHELDYVCSEKGVVESVLDMEMDMNMDTTHQGIFYKDNGHAFHATLFYGQNTLLLSWDMITLTIIDYWVESFVLAGIITFSINKLLAWCRSSLGKRNLATKTLIDERFLI